jgi:hypothetical protein
MPAPPFLDLDGRVQYLYDRGYFDRGAITDEHRERLAHINFHYFLGYARNYRMLVGRGKVGNGERRPDQVFSLIERDHEVSELIYSGIRRAEWRLRNLVVKHYCEFFDSTGSFLNESQYVQTSENSASTLINQIVGQTLRYREPYVEDRVNRAAEAEGWIRHRDYTPEARQECFRLVQNLELWSIVDGLSLGTLSRFITECDNRENSTDRVWKLIANDLGVAKAVFPTNIMSLTVLRNTVAHHARLWMRPATQAPKQPKVFAKRLRRADHKSMLVAFYNLALFQGPEGYRDFADRVDALVSADPVYAYGVQKVHHHSDPDRSV